MAKYEVVVCQTVKQSIMVTVEAESEDEAFEKGLDAAYDAPLAAWEEVDSDDTYVDSCEVIEPRFETQAQRDVDGAWMDNLGESPDF